MASATLSFGSCFIINPHTSALLITSQTPSDPIAINLSYLVSSMCWTSGSEIKPIFLAYKSPSLIINKIITFLSLLYLGLHHQPKYDRDQQVIHHELIFQFFPHILWCALSHLDELVYGHKIIQLLVFLWQFIGIVLHVNLLNLQYSKCF
jgi:hypothetical protein